MDLLQLQYFLKLAGIQHVSKTAELLHISQPSLSATIRKLEKELGAPLFIRKGRSIVLSPYGEACRDYVEEAFLALENGKRTIDTMLQTEAGTLNLGMLSPYVWTEVFQEFAQQHPDIQVNRLSAEGFHFIDRLLDGTIDMYLGGLNGIDTLSAGKLQSHTLFEDDMVLLVPDDHPLAKETAIDLRQCENLGFINLESGTNLQQFIDSLFARAGVTPRVIMVCDYTIRDQMVADQHGVSVTTRLSARKTDAQKVTYIPIVYPGEKRKLGLVWRRGQVFTRAMQHFFDAAQEFYSRF